MNRTMVEIKKWHYNTHDVVLRIPSEIGLIWFWGYGVREPKPFECVKATTWFNGQTTMGKFNTMKRPIHLGMDEAGNFALIQEKRYVYEE